MGAVTMYTDGACRGNPGPGGYGVVLLGAWDGQDRREEFCGGFRRTTNNRMELVAAIKGLESLKRACAVDAYSDSTYLVNGFSKGWARRWEKKGWVAKGGKRRLNADLWERLLRCSERHKITFTWIKGHNGDPENERCEQLAQASARRLGLVPDPGYSSAA